jgi:hypothetical protein
VGITEAAVNLLVPEYPDLTVIARDVRPADELTQLLRLGLQHLPSADTNPGPVPGPVVAVRVGVEGIRGMRSTQRCRYTLIVDTSAIAFTIPQVWVAAPADAEIRHVNIWPAHKSFCRWTGTHLPSFCWRTFADGWTEAPQRSRTLGAALEYAKQLVNTENHDSPAR